MDRLPTPLAQQHCCDSAHIRCPSAPEKRTDGSPAIGVSAAVSLRWMASSVFLTSSNCCIPSALVLKDRFAMQLLELSASWMLPGEFTVKLKLSRIAYLTTPVHIADEFSVHTRHAQPAQHSSKPPVTRHLGRRKSLRNVEVCRGVSCALRALRGQTPSGQHCPFSGMQLWRVQAAYQHAATLF